MTVSVHFDQAKIKMDGHFIVNYWQSLTSEMAVLYSAALYYIIILYHKTTQISQVLPIPSYITKHNFLVRALAWKFRETTNIPYSMNGVM